MKIENCATGKVINNDYYFNTKENAMMKVHYCAKCDRISYSTVRIFTCKKCDSECKRFKIEFVEFIKLDMDERKAYIDAHK